MECAGVAFGTVHRASVRRATTDDLDILVVLGAEYAAADVHAFDPETARDGFAPLLVDDRFGIVLVAESGGAAGTEPVGYAVVTWGWSVEIGGLDVVLDEIYTRIQGAGIGTQLLHEIEATCRARGVKRIFLETERPNERARQLYARHGWVEDDSIWMSKELH